MNRNGGIFYHVFAFWYFMDILLRTDFEDKLNLLIMNVFDIRTPDVNHYVDVAVLVLLVVQIVFFQRYSMRELSIIVIISGPIVLGTILSGNNHLVSMLLFVVASKNVEIDKVIRLAYIMLCITIPFVIVMCFVGVLPDYTVYRNSLLRHSLGFEHPNRLGMRCFQFAACHCYIWRKKKARLLTYIVIGSLAYFAYKVPNSQTAYFSLVILLFIYMIYHIIGNKRAAERVLLKVFGAMTAFLSIGTVIMCFFNAKAYPLYNAIDRFMSRRFWWCYMMYKYYGVSWFGQKVSTLIPDRRYVGVYRLWYLDNAFFSILLCYGIIVYLLFVYIYISTVYTYIKEANFMMVAILFLYSLYGIMTTGFYMMSHNIFLLAISSFFYSKQLNREVVKAESVVEGV